ncbi:MAG: SpoIIE family protein phosphatase [Acidobacteria bacterium]|nr:SpoIIE family protein phosphatase [Acidobacteriota bacterium]MCY4634225.1 SpoIIE family protein phosphatase [Acidobacteriota bacterium]
MPTSRDSAADRGRPTARLGDDAVAGARVMVEAFRLTTDGSDAARILNGILDGLVSLVDHDAAGVYVVDPLGARVSHSVARGCINPAPVDMAAPFEEHGVVGRVLATGEPVSLHDQPGVCEGREGAHSRLVVPLVGSRGRVRGALDLWSDRSSGYDRAAEEAVGVYASAVAATIENARLIAEVRDKRRLDSDLALARDVMEDLLPRATPTLAGFDIAGAHESSLAVGGDYYEFIPLPEDRWGVVIADVVGKGIAAALLVAAIRASIASLVGHELAVRAIMRRANRFFHESVEEGRYVTLFYMVLDVPARSLLYVNAGHVPPVLVRANGEVELLEEGGVPLGLFQAPRYFEGHATLAPGDVVGLYTDGIVEQTNPEGEEYGSSRLIATLREAGKAGATELCSRVMQDVHRFGAGRQTDDRTLVVIRSNADPAARRIPS